jgi:nucleoside-diphosphate-sugar epimerase
MDVSRIVVLGSRGFVAGELIRCFEADGRSCRPIGSGEIDLTSENSVAALTAILKPEDALVVCSALTPEWGRDRATFLKNVRMVDHVCTALASVPCAHVVYISSDSVYAARTEDLNEHSCCETDDLYGLAHVVREKLLHEAGSAVAIPLLILRPGALYGNEDTHNAYGPNRFLRTALADRTITLFGEGEEERDHIYIRDFARIVLLCIRHRTTGILGAVHGTSVSFRELAEGVRRAVGSDVVIQSAPRRVPVTHRRFDPAALRAAFPEFRPTSFPDALREMLTRPMSEPSPPKSSSTAESVDGRASHR